MSDVVIKALVAIMLGVLSVPSLWAQTSGTALPKNAGKELKSNNTKKVQTKKAEITKKPVVPPSITIEAAALAAAQSQAKEQAEKLAVAQAVANKTNIFNRTMRPLTKYNLSPMEDGIHDPGIEVTKILNTPLDAYTDLPRNKAGNRVDWVEALAAKKITPRWDRLNPNVEGVVMDMDIVRIPKGSMHNVVFPHKQHTEWLTCSNCHPEIFIPQKGANQINMSLILSGQKCGVCHGKVAFPPSECSKCHSQKKEVMQNDPDAI